MKPFDTYKEFTLFSSSKYERESGWKFLSKYEKALELHENEYVLFITSQTAWILLKDY